MAIAFILLFNPGVTGQAYTKKIANKEWDHDLEIKSQDEIGRLSALPFVFQKH